jgi:predicted outer membrane protein
VIAAAGVALAGLPQQDPNSGNQQPGQQQGQQPGINRTNDLNRVRAGAHNDVDHYIVKLLIQANKNEEECARLAERNSQNADVKKFAQRAIDDHTQFTSRLEKFRGKNQTTATQPGRSGNQAGQFNQPGSQAGQFNQGNQAGNQAGQINQGNQPGNQPGAANNQQGFAQQQQGDQPQAGQQPQFGGRRPMMRGGNAMADNRGGAHQFVKIMEDIAQQTHREMQRELQQKEGVHFDRAFVGSQIAMHVWLTQALTIFEQNASPELRPVLQEGLQTAREHLNHARDIMARLDQGAGKTTAAHESHRFGTR